VFDGQAGLHQNSFRDFDPATGRYAESDLIGLHGGINTYAYVVSNPLALLDPLGLLQWTNTALYQFDMTTGMALTPYPGAAFARTRAQAGAVTVASWALSARCHCDGAGGFAFDEFVVDFNEDVHMRATFPANITSWMIRAEGDHVMDGFKWASSKGRQVASTLEGEFKGQRFSSEADCQFSTTQQLDAALMSGGIDAAYRASIETWDASGKHHWGDPAQRP
jgi:RHS repeat-associated protein